MTAMYNNLQATETENDDPNKEKGQCNQRKKPSAPKRSTKANESKDIITQTLQEGGKPFRKRLFLVQK